MTKFNLKQNNGFTLIETFVAITILLIAVLIPLGVMSKAIQDGLFIKNKVIAYYLAQEGMELVISQIASNLKAPVEESTPWLGYLARCTSGGGGICTISTDLDSGDIITGTCSGSDPRDCPYLRQKEKSGYNYDLSYPESIFKRSVEIGNPINMTGIGEMAVPVKVTVLWKNKNGLEDQSLVLDDYVFNVGYAVQ